MTDVAAGTEPQIRFMIEPLEEEETRHLHGGKFDDLADVYGSYFPNSLRIMARDPDLMRAMVDVGELVLQRPGKVPLALKWLVAGLSSRASGCRYCQVHTLNHGANHGVPVEKIEAVWEFESSDLFTESERAALRLALAAGVTPNATTPQHFEDLKKHFDDDGILEIVAVICYFGFFNRWNDTLAVPLEEDPLSFGKRHLSESGWTPGRHTADGE